MTHWVQGCLHKVKLINFVTYDYVEFVAGPHLNIIIGPNGTGKSSIVCALCLGLGGKTNLLGRAREVGEFVKHGADEAIIQLELYNRKGNNHVIKRVITRTDNKSHWFINEKPSSHKEITTLVKQLNIDVDNLCQFLPQDMVAEFAKMSPSELLMSTERAVSGHELLDIHKSLITLKNEQKSITTTQASKEEYLENLTKRNDYLKDIVSKYRERDKYLTKIKILEQKRPWLLYEKQRTKYHEFREEKKKVSNQVEELRASTQPLHDTVETAKTVLVEADNEIKQVTDDLNQINTKIRRIEDLIASIKDNIEERIEEFKVKEREEASKEIKLRELKNNIRAYEAEISKMPSDAELQQKRDSLNTEAKGIAKELGKIDTQLNETVAEQQAQESKRRQIEKQIQRLNDSRNKKLEILRRYDKDTFEAVEWLRQNKEIFSGEVLEPFQLIINVPNPSNAKYIESIISRNDRKAFVFERADDLNKFMGELRDRKRLTINAVLAPTNFNYSSSHNMATLRSLGFTAYLSNLIECPELAKRYLCRYYKLHNVPIGSNAVDRNVESINKVIGGGLYFSPTNRYHVSKSRYCDDTISSISQIKDSKIFNLTVDTKRIEELNNEMKSIQSSAKDLIARINTMKEQQAKLRSTEERNRNDKNVVSQELRYRCSIVEKIKSRKAKIQQLSNTKINLEAERSRCNAHVKAELERRKTQQSQLYSAYSLLEEKLHQKSLRTISKIVAAVAVSEAEDILSSSCEELTKAQEKYQALSDNVLKEKQYAMELLEKAKKACGLTTNELPPKYKQKFKKYACNDVEDLDNQLNEARTMAECTNEVDPQVIKEYTERKEEIEMYSKEVEANQQKLVSLQQRLTSLHEQWYEPVSSLVEQINEKFRVFFATLKCCGEVLLAEHEDYEKWGIDIKVQFRNSDDLKRLTSSYQSGGEKSVSTILYLLSLQGLTDCPFRVVDEINQGMDPRNERKVFEMMAKTATVKGTSQYFLITPKLLPDLDFNDRMTILAIFNGQGLDNSKNESFSIEKVIAEDSFRQSQNGRANN